MLHYRKIRERYTVTQSKHFDVSRAGFFFIKLFLITLKGLHLREVNGIYLEFKWEPRNSLVFRADFTCIETTPFEQTFSGSYLKTDNVEFLDLLVYKAP